MNRDPLELNALPPLRTGQARHHIGYIQPAEGIRLPFGIIEAPSPGPVLLISAGVHGAEFCSIETASSLLRDTPSFDKGTLVILPVINIGGFMQRRPFIVPEDGQNLNEMFPGLANGSHGERLARWLVDHVYPQVDAYVDLHNGDIVEALVPFTIFPHGKDRSRDLAIAFGFELALSSPGKGFAIAAASELGVPSIIAEISGNGLWSKDMVATLRGGIERLMHYLGMKLGTLEAPAVAPRIIHKWDPRALCDGFWYPAVSLLQEIAIGDHLGDIRDVFGTVLSEVTADTDGFILYLLTSLSVNHGEALLGVARDLKE